MNSSFESAATLQARATASKLLEIAVDLGRRHLPAGIRTGSILECRTAPPCVEPPESPVPVWQLAQRDNFHGSFGTRRGFLTLAIAIWISFLAAANKDCRADESPVALEPIAESDFEESVNGAHGWAVKAVATWDLPFRNLSSSRQTDGGISGRYLRFTESQGDGYSAHFFAPEKYLGDKRRAYGGVLEWDYRQMATENLIPGGTLTLHSQGIRLSFYVPGVPDSGWRHYTAPLQESAAWFDSDTRERATRDQLVKVLSKLEMVTIRAEFSSGSYENTQIDNVRLLAPVPSGHSTPTLGIATYTGLNIQGEIGARYQIQASENLSKDWIPLADVVLPSSSFFWVDRDSATSNRRFYRAIKQDN